MGIDVDICGADRIGTGTGMSSYVFWCGTGNVPVYTRARNESRGASHDVSRCLAAHVATQHHQYQNNNHNEHNNDRNNSRHIKDDRNENVSAT